MADKFPCPYCALEQQNADRLLHHFRRCKALKKNDKVDYAASQKSTETPENVSKPKISTRKTPVRKRRTRSKTRRATGNTKKKTTAVATRTLKRRRRKAVKSGKRKRVARKLTLLSRSPTPVARTTSLVTRSRSPLSRTPAPVSITVRSPRLRSIPSDVQLNATAQKLQAQATLIKRLLQENLQLINAEELISKTLKSVELEKDELLKEKTVIQDQITALTAEVDKAKQETEHEKLETAGVRQQLDAAILEKSDLEKQLQASEQIRSVEVNKVKEELCETQRQLKEAKKRCEESENSLTAASNLEKQRINTYAYPHIQPPSSQMFPVYDPRRAYAVSSSAPPIQIGPPTARTMPPKAVWSNYQNTNPPHDNRISS